MSPDEFRACIHPREYPRFILALVFAAPVTLAVLALIFVTFGFALAYILLLAFFIWFGFEIFYATLLANWILVSEHNYPRLHALLEETKERIGVTQRVDIIVYQQGEFNAYFSMLFARRAIFVNSEVLEQGVTDDELRWIIGRFVGQVRAKRRMGPMAWVIALAERLVVFNLFIYPYIRATAYTGDRVALAGINGDITTAIAAMNKLMVGRQLGYSVNPAGIVMQYRRVKGSLFAFLARLMSPLPHTIPRYFDLIAFAERRYPQEYQKFAAMNPSFQTAGGAWKLLWSTQKPSYAGQGLSAAAVGWLLILGAIGTGVVGVGLIAVAGSGGPGELIAALTGGGYNSSGAYDPYSDYPTIEAPAAADYYDAPAPAEAPADPYYEPAATYSTFAAYAISDSSLAWGAAWNASSRADAESHAVQECGRSDCRAILYFQNACGALAIDSYNRAWGADWDANLSDARAKALTACGRYGSSCQIQNAVCSSG